MRLFKIAGLTLAAATIAAPAAAVVTTFASFAPGIGGANVRFVNATDGDDAVFYTTAGATTNAPAARDVRFTFLQDALFPSVNNVTASFTLNGTVTDTVATVFGAQIVQRAMAGSFSFTSSAPIVIGSTFYATGSNLLSGTFTEGGLVGTRGGTAANLTGSTPGSTITYTSDFVTFAGGSDYDFAFSLSAITPALDALPTDGTPTSALRSFRAVLGGQFSSDPAPSINAVPAPASAALLIAGLSLLTLTRRAAIAA